MVIGLILTVLVIAHFAEKREEAHGEHTGSTYYLNAWTPSAYTGENLKFEPSLLLVGDSQSVMVISPTPNHAHGAGIGGTFFDGITKELDERHPATSPRQYLRISGAAFAPFDYIFTVGVWLDRAGPRKRLPVLIGVHTHMSANERIHVRTIETLNRLPGSMQSVMRSLETVPEGQRAIASANKALERARANQLPFVDNLEHDITGWSRAQKYYYGSPERNWFLAYQRVEAPILNGVFNRIDQAFPDPMVPYPKVQTFPPLKALIGFLVSRDLIPICYLQPRHPTLYPDSPAVDAHLEKLRAYAKEVGCLTVLDGFHPVRKPEHFGYMLASMDHEHLSPEGHRVLAKALLEQGEAAGVWSSILGSEVVP